jgi:hypothetical protein
MYIQQMNPDIYFSFSLYGHDDHYWRGLLENLHLLNIHMPNAKIIILYSQVPSAFLQSALACKNILLWKIRENTKYRMIQRLLITDHFTSGIFFIRDADSRISERDIGCIQSFIQSDKQYHTIRDHFYHKSRIMGGTFGFKKLPGMRSLCFTELFNTWLQTRTLTAEYGLDEDFLRDSVFFTVYDSLIIHTNSVAHTSEHTIPIPMSLKDNTDFIGNVYDWTGSSFKPRFNYWDFMTPGHMQWLQSQNQYDIIVSIGLEFDITRLEWDQRTNLLNTFLDACFKTKREYDACRILAKYRHALVDDGLIRRSNQVIQMLRATRRVIASFDPERQPKPDEIVIIYGEYCHDMQCLPMHVEKESDYVLKRHPLYFTDIVHDVVEYDPVWEPVEQIYILNLEERRDRYMHQLIELCRLQAPLHRIYHYKATKSVITGDRSRDAYIGASTNHLDAVEHFLQKGFGHCLILEDDFLFNMDYVKIKKQLRTFFERNYDYDICFAGYSKYGELRDYDDLLRLSYQSCTTSSAYFLRKETAHKVHACLRTGVEQMKQGQNPGIYCCDRYWAILQPNKKFFVFGDKLGYQRITYSDIVARTNYNFD